MCVRSGGKSELGGWGQKGEEDEAEEQAACAFGCQYYSLTYHFNVHRS